MAYEKLTGTFESSNGTDNCAYYIYVPVLPMNVGYKGIIQISHGMCEYIEVPCTAVYSYRSQYGQFCCKAVSHTLS